MYHHYHSHFGLVVSSMTRNLFLIILPVSIADVPSVAPSVSAMPSLSPSGMYHHYQSHSILVVNTMTKICFLSFFRFLSQMPPPRFRANSHRESCKKQKTQKCANCATRVLIQFSLFAFSETSHPVLHQRFPPRSPVNNLRTYFSLRTSLMYALHCSHILMVS